MTRVTLPADLVRRVERLPGVLATLNRAAERGAARARELAPVATGQYRDGIEPDSGLDEKGRPVGRVNANDWKSLIIELGTPRTPAFAVLRRTLDGLR